MQSRPLRLATLTELCVAASPHPERVFLSGRCNQMRELAVTAGVTQPHVLLEYGRAPGTLGGNLKKTRRITLHSDGKHWA